MFVRAHCVSCGRPGDVLCSACGAHVRPATEGPLPEGTVSCTVLLAYEGVARDLVVGLKYRNGRELVPRVGRALAHRLRLAGVDDLVGLVTWAPTSRARRRERGFDQAELLARDLARRLHRPAVGLLERRPGPPQTGRDRAQRIAGPAFALRPDRRARRLGCDAGPGILLVDDVLTTGATIRAAAAALAGGPPGLAGAPVHAAAVAYTASHHGAPAASAPDPCDPPQEFPTDLLKVEPPGTETRI